MKISFEFEHEIGEVLNLKCLPDVKWADTMMGPARFIVVGFRTDTCVSGTQGFYLCRMVDSQGNMGRDVAVMNPFEMKVWKVKP